jgi:hypothetical protein
VGARQGSRHEAGRIHAASVGRLHYDGARDEEVWVLISGYGPTRADVLDKGELFGRIPAAKK